MKRVYSTDNVALAWHMRNVLQQHGIEAQVRNVNLYSVAGEIPVNECLPEVWVGDLDVTRSERLIREVQFEPAGDGPDWTCANCGEPNLDTFDICWNCQHSRHQEDS